MEQTNTGITGTGHALGSEVITNDFLTNALGVTDEWITSRVGIRERRRAARDECISTLGVRAAREALAMAGLAADELDAIICTTVTPDYSQMPSTACLIHPAQVEIAIPHVVQRLSAIAIRCDCRIQPYNCFPFKTCLIELDRFVCIFYASKRFLRT